MSKLETRISKLERTAGGDEREPIELIWERDREPVEGELVISWLPAREVRNE